MTTKILNEHEKHEIEKKLHEQFGIKEILGKVVMRGEEKLFFFTGDADEKELKTLEEIVPVEKIGVYFAKIINDDIKLTIEGSQILKNQISKGIFEISSEQSEEWMMGGELNIKTGLKGFVIIKNRETGDFLGCGKASESKITNFIPKSRRLKSKG